MMADRDDAPVSLGPVVRAVTAGGALLGEGPVWHAATARLTWVDIYGRRIHALDTKSGEQRHWHMPDRVSCAIPRSGGGLVVALSRAIALFDPETGRLEEVARLDASAAHRFNDAKCDPQGRLWIGSMNEADADPTAALYRLDAGGLCLVEPGIAITNSLGWSPGGDILYLADSPERRIRAYAFDGAAGTIGARRAHVEVDLAHAYPDGSAVDVQGHLWNAQWGGARVVRYAADGSVDQVVAMPVSRPTSACFGGADMTTLFVTSAACELTQAQLRREPLAGAVFAVQTGVAGVPVPAFAF